MSGFVIFGGPMEEDLTVSGRKRDVMSTPFDTITTNTAQGSAACDQSSSAGLQ